MHPTNDSSNVSCGKEREKKSNNIACRLLLRGEQSLFVLNGATNDLVNCSSRINKLHVCYARTFKVPQLPSGKHKNYKKHVIKDALIQIKASATQANRKICREEKAARLGG